jgi:hypothetical protein
MVLIRPINIIILPAFYFLLTEIPSRKFETCGKIEIKKIISFLIGFIPMLLSLLIYNWLTFGTPFKNGYNYWLPHWYNDVTTTFNWSYLWESIGTDKGNLVGYGEYLTGLSLEFYPFTVFLAGLVGIFMTRKQPFTKFSIAVMAVSLPVWGLYFFHAPRFIMPLISLWLILAAYGCYAIVNQFLTKLNLNNHQPIFAISFITLGILLSIPWGWNLVAERSYMWTTQITKQAWPLPMKYEITKIIDEHIEDNAYIISRIEGTYIDQYVLRNTDRHYMALSNGTEYHNSNFPQSKYLPVALENIDTLRTLISQGTPVYLDETSCPAYRVLYERFFIPKGDDLCGPLRDAFELESVFEMAGYHLYRLHVR